MPHTSYREFLLIQNKFAGVQSGSSQRDSFRADHWFQKRIKNWGVSEDTCQSDDDLTIWRHSILFGGPAEEPGPMQCEINGHKELCSESNSSVALSIDSGRLWWWDVEDHGCLEPKWSAYRATPDVGHFDSFSEGFLNWWFASTIRGISRNRLT